MSARGWVWAMASVAVVLSACGGRTLDLRELSAAGASNLAGAEPAGGRAAGGSGAGTAGTAGTGGTSVGQGARSAQGGAEAGSAGTPAAPCSRVDEVPASQSAAWTWHRCGEAPPDPELQTMEAVSSVSLSADGALLVTTSSYHAARRRVALPFAASTSLKGVGAGGSPWAELSRDGSRLLLMGEATELYDWTSGERLPFVDPLAQNVHNVDSNAWCVGTETRLSPDGNLLAGKSYGTAVLVYETVGFTRVATLETHHCDQGIAFSGDGRWLLTPSASFSTTTFKPRAGSDLTWPAYDPTTNEHGEQRFVTSTCNGARAFLTKCSMGNCTTLATNNAIVGGKHPSLSPEEHWLVSGGRLLHLPSNQVVVFDENASESTFAPNGDLIAGELDGRVARYCRAD